MAKKSSFLTKVITLMLSLLLIGVMLFASYLFIANSPVRKQLDVESHLPDERETATSFFKVAEGQALYIIISNLQKEEFIRDALFLKLYLKLFPQSLTIQAGDYIIPPNLTAIDTLHYLAKSNPDQNLIFITIPEGLSIREVALLWQESGFFSADSFLDAAMDPQLLETFAIPSESFEGWLFPDSYRVPSHLSAEQAVTLMARQFFTVLTEIEPSWSSLPSTELKDRVILASIVQKEHQIKEEAPLMASVFLNRLKIGMPLGTDATISYAKKERLGEGHAQRILFADLTMDDPYNSYTHLGLPPGPIGLSGRVALNAVFHPIETNFFYFVRIPETAGKHHFSTTFDEHRYHANIWRAWANNNL